MWPFSKECKKKVPRPVQVVSEDGKYMYHELSEQITIFQLADLVSSIESTGYSFIGLVTNKHLLFRKDR